MSNIAVVGCGRRNSLPPLMQHDTRRLEGRKSFNPSLHFPQSRILTPTNPKANILIDKDGRARLTDFGLTSIIRGEYSVASPQETQITSTTTWAAPEILGGDHVSKEGDIFTFAMVAVEVRARGTSKGSFSAYPSSKRHSRVIPRSPPITKPPY